MTLAAPASSMELSDFAGQPSWRFASDRVEAAVTRTGGHLGPVRFALDGTTVEPYSVAPWAEEAPSPDLPPMLQALRGDFFCAPFGGNETVHRGEQHPPHGETANATWRCESIEQSADAARLHLSLATTVRPGRVDKFIELRAGQTAVYCRHVVTGMAGPMNLGHHAMLKFPDAPGSGHLSTSRVRYGQVAPLPLEDPAKRGYSALRSGGLFRRLDRVPLAAGGTTDVSRYPARRGFEDLVMLVHEAREDFAWTAVTFPAEGYVWYALKDPRTLRSTICWLTNGGRHYPPWNGRHVNILGLEEVTSYFHYGLAESVAENPVNRLGYPTAVELTADRPLTVNYIMGVAAIPAGFGSVRTIRTTRDAITLVSPTGGQATAAVDVGFLYQSPP